MTNQKLPQTWDEIMDFINNLPEEEQDCLHEGDDCDCFSSVIWGQDDEDTDESEDSEEDEEDVDDLDDLSKDLDEIDDTDDSWLDEIDESFGDLWKDDDGGDEI